MLRLNNIFLSILNVAKPSPLCFQSEGTLLATGSYDGFARIWTKDGESPASKTPSADLPAESPDCGAAHDLLVDLVCLTLYV